MDRIAAQQVGRSVARNAHQHRDPGKDEPRRQQNPPTKLQERNFGSHFGPHSVFISAHGSSIMSVHIIGRPFR